MFKNTNAAPFLNLENSAEFTNPDDLKFEIVERKGLGHPDSLADGLAESISNEYSKYCLNRWGIVPHHNLDKLYIGAGLWEVGYGLAKMKKPALIKVQGRISDSFAGEPIDLVGIQRRAVASYLERILPNAKLDEHIIIQHDSTQHTIRKNWFSPKSLDDLPELKRLTASDTAVCVAHSPLTFLETLCLETERYFWVLSPEGKPLRPRFPDVGQDIKVMGIRNDQKIELHICFPLLSSQISSKEMQLARSKEIEADLNRYIKSKNENTPYDIRVALTNGYLLPLGSCIECGEEGIVGRGNALSGLISIMRPKGNEAYWGKNPVYHVGRVQMYLTREYSRELYKATGIPNTIYTIGVHSTDLIPPHTMRVHAKEKIDTNLLQELAQKVFSKETYLASIIKDTITDNFLEKMM